MIASSDRYSVTRQPPARLHDPAMQRVGAEIEQQAAQHEFRHVAEQDRCEQQHGGGDRGRGQAGEAAGAAGTEIQHGAADRDAAGVAAEHARQHVGDARGVQLALEIGLAIRRDFDARGVEQRAGRGHEDHGNDVAGNFGQLRTRDNARSRARSTAASARCAAAAGRSSRALARLRRRNSGETERDMCGQRAADQDHGQAERRAGAVPGEIQAPAPSRRLPRVRRTSACSRNGRGSQTAASMPVTTLIEPSRIRQPVAPRKPPTTG